MDSISEPLLTEAVLCPSTHFLLPFMPPDTRCLRLPAAVGGHTSVGPGLVPQHFAPTHHGWFEVHRRAARLRWELLAEDSLRISILQGPLAHELINY